MRFSHLRGGRFHNQSLYITLLPYIMAMSAVLVVLALAWPHEFHLHSRLQILPLIAMVGLNTAYGWYLKTRIPSVKLDRIVLGMTGVLYLVFFLDIDPRKSLSWPALLLPFLWQASNIRFRRDSAFRFFTLCLVMVGAFVIHIPWHSGSSELFRWTLTSVTKIATLLGVATWAQLFQKHSRAQSRALTAAYNKLAQKQKQIIQTERFAALGELSTGVAHEVNNSLTVVVGGLEQIASYVATQNPDWQNMRKHTERMDRATQRIQRIVSQLRSLSRDPRRDPPQYLDLRVVVDDALFLVREQLATRNIVWTTKVAEEPVSVLGHGSEICQVLINLVNNARDVLESHSRRKIEIRLFRDGPNAVLEVEDTGPGIPPAVQERIFSPFVTTKPVGKGTGLGLSISYGIIKRNGGNIHFATGGAGTVFRVELPLASQAAAA